MKKHQPVHLYVDNSWYFLTVKIYGSQHILDEDVKKQLLLEKLKYEFKSFGYELKAWVILDNHYHLEFKTDRGNILSKILNRVHGNISYTINKMDNQEKRKVFQNYWDSCIRSERDLWTRFNYIHHNPVKHGYSQRMEEYGKEWLDDCFQKYPIIDFTLEGDND